MAVPTIFVDLSGYTQALLDYAEQIEDIGPLETLRDELFATIQAGEGKTLVESSVNGKTFGWELNLTAEQQFQAVVQAIKEYKGQRITSTYADFSQIVR